MRLAELVAATTEAFDADLAMADVHAICEYDRYQASAGIMAAAAYVADRARAAGLSDVAVLAFPADGAERWWTYRAPQSWTPVKATLSVDGKLLVSYPDQPYSLAAYSASTPAGGRSLPLVRYSAVRTGADPRGAPGRGRRAGPARGTRRTDGGGRGGGHRRRSAERSAAPGPGSGRPARTGGRF
jgi:hypothetical protein